MMKIFRDFFSLSVSYDIPAVVAAFAGRETLRELLAWPE